MPKASRIHPTHTNYIQTASIRSNSLITHGIINSGGGRVAGIYPSYANANKQSVIYNGRLLSLIGVESIVAHVLKINLENIKRKITETP